MGAPDAVRRRRKGATRDVLAVVVADGEPASGDAGSARGADLLVAADGGARWLAAQGLRPDLVVGDLDSLDRRDIERLNPRARPSMPAIPALVQPDGSRPAARK